jgi:hypothetical protein
VPPHIREAFQDELKALMAERAEAGETDERVDDRERGEPVAAAAPAARSETASAPSAPAAEAAVKQAVPERKEEDDMPQTQMAAAFAALREQMASESPPEETKA